MPERRYQPVFMQVLCVPALEAGKTHIRGAEKGRSVLTIIEEGKRWLVL